MAAERSGTVRVLSPAQDGATRVKICGITDPGDAHSALAAGANYLGFVFFAKSPRHVTPAQARDIAGDLPPGVMKVALVVNADDATLDEITEQVPLDMLQLHGKESPARVAQIRARYGLPVMKAVGISTPEDLPQLIDYGTVADQLLIDAKAPKGAALPGGNGVTFDWRLIANRRFLRPWMLAGGLTPENVAEAIRLTGARQVDVSSGVESSPGRKDPERMAAFIRAARA